MSSALRVVDNSSSGRLAFEGPDHVGRGVDRSGATNATKTEIAFLRATRESPY